MRTRVKVCCIASVAEAQLAVAAGVDALGLVGPMPSGPGMIAGDMLRRIAAWTPPPVSSFLLTTAVEAPAIIEHVRASGTDTVQLVARSTPAACQAVREALPGVRVVQVLHVQGPEAVEEAQAFAPYVHALLLDSGNPRAAVPTFGGTGKIHDWSISRRIVETVPVPVILAGGLRPGNVQAAVRMVRPFGVDVCSGLRVDGALSPTLLADFVEAVRLADQDPR
ncbi:MAG: phosphoribosylanthranilate isomerase [bacterium]